MSFGGVGADHQKILGMVDIIERIGSGALTDGGSHPFEARGVADPGTVVHMG